MDDIVFGPVDMQPESKVVLDQLLNGFYNLGSHSIFQYIGSRKSTDPDHVLKECGMCVGAWASYFMGMKGSGNKWDFIVGRDLLVEAFQCPKYYGSDGLSGLLRKHGAPSCPFGSKGWDVHPYRVLRSAAIERYGYHHQPEETTIQ